MSDGNESVASVVMPVVGNVNGLAIMKDRRLVDVGKLERENQQLRQLCDDKSGALRALRGMVEQFCRSRLYETPDGRPMYDHACMAAAEDAVEVLINNGLLEDDQVVS